jgi:YVTN family beta-propeller protein
MLNQLTYFKIFVLTLFLCASIPCFAQTVYVPNFGSPFNLKVKNFQNGNTIATIPIQSTGGVSHPSGSLYYSKGNGNSDGVGLHIINTATNTVVGNIFSGITPNDICISNDGQKLYALFYQLAAVSSSALLVIETTTHSVIDTILIPVPRHCFELEPTVDFSKIFLLSDSNYIYKFNTATNTIDQTIILPNTALNQLEVNPAGDLLYVYSSIYANGLYQTKVTKIDALSGNVVANSNFPNSNYLPYNGSSIFELDPTGGKIFLNNLVNNVITPLLVYDASTLTQTNSLNFPFYVKGIDFNAVGSIVYVLGYDGTGILNSYSANNFALITSASSPNELYNKSTGSIFLNKNEIDMQGGSPLQSIPNNSTIPITSNFTDFGSINTTSWATRTFYLKNLGTAPLHVTQVSLTGLDQSMFTLSSSAGLIMPGMQDSIIVSFYPCSVGLKTANIQIQCNDADESLYTFSIQGTGTLPKYAYTTHAAANTVGVIDQYTNQLVMDINVGNYPNGICLNSSDTKLFVTNSISNDVTVINTLSNSVVHTIPVGNYPVGICASPTNDKLFVANQNSNTVSVLNANTYAVDATIPVGNQPFGITVSLDGSRVFVSNYGSNTVSVINTLTNTVIATLTVGLAPKGITLNPSGTIVYVANSGSNNVSSFQVSNLSMNPNVSVGNSPYSICFNATGTKYYVSNYYDFTVKVVPIAGGFFQTIPVGNYPAGLSLSDDGTKLWVTNYGSDNMSVLNTVNNTVIQTIGIGSGPISFGSSLATVGVPEIKVKGGTPPMWVQIENYDYSPSAADNTLMGGATAGNSQTKTFYIQNSGSNDLTINNVELYGADMSMFSLSNLPTTIAPGVTDSFTITFAPTSNGTKLAYVHITSDVPNLSHFYFGIQGEGIGAFTFTFPLKFFIEGYYLGASTMQSVLLNQNSPAATSSETDFVSVELRDPSMANNVAYSYSGVLQTDGQLTCTFPNEALGNSYYLCLRQRNSIETWSANPVMVQTNSTYDFSTSADKAYGNNQAEIEPGIFALYSGDINQDLSIDAFDYLILDPDVINGVSGFLSTDLTGDGNVDAFDYILLDANLINGVGAVTP